MTIELNSLNFNSADTGIYLDEPIEGLELPPIRTSSGNYAGRDGGYVGKQLYSARPVSLTGRVFGANTADVEERRRLIQTTLASREVTMRVVTNAGAAYLLYCRLVDFKMPIKRELTYAFFKIDLVASDPTLYDDANAAPLTASIPKFAPGGYVYNVVYPVVYTPGSTPTTVNNAGTATVYPIITITGGSTNPTIENLSTNKSLTVNLTTTAGDVLVIDMRQRTVLLNGGNVFGAVAANSEFWSLSPGDNNIKLSSSIVTDSISAVLSWRNGYMGI